MQVTQSDPQTIDEYITGFPPDIQARLEKIRLTIREAAPAAKETIKYKIPTFTLNGNIVSFAAYEQHIGLYPAPRAIEEFKTELSQYKGGKGTVQFPLNQPIPYDLISRIVKFNVKEFSDRAAAKKKKKKSA